MTEVKHTPIPWHTDGGFIYKEDETIAIMNKHFLEPECRKELAAYIVKCVNMHDELVEALHKLSCKQNWDHTDWIGDYNPQNIASTALKKAGAL